MAGYSIKYGGCSDIPAQTYTCGSWKVHAAQSHILQSRCSSSNPCKDDIEDEFLCPYCLYDRELDLPQLPEMTFACNSLHLEHEKGFVIGFNALDALKMVDSKNDAQKVAVAEAWKESRMEHSQIRHVVKPFDWTYSTHYKGTLVRKTDKVKVTQTEERIDMEKLKVKAKILFYADMMLFEDELADNGTAQFSVKIRVMPDNFFILMRYFLRIDNLLVRIIDTRIYHELGNNYLLREHVTRESKIEDLTVGLNLLRNPQELWEHLPTVQSEYERIEFQ